ncbi:MAG: protein kinase [Acidobacteriota bacterium]|nr:protein kinase [Acidobacteriota bacterium]
MAIRLGEHLRRMLGKGVSSEEELSSPAERAQVQGLKDEDLLLEDEPASSAYAACESTAHETPSNPEKPGPDHGSTEPVSATFALGRLLGSGGMGEVYEAYDSRLKRRVAIKLLKARGERDRIRFANEARLQARVDHPYVCKVYEVGQEGNHGYIAMQRIRGKPLQHVLDRLDLRARVLVLAKAAEGVHEAHRRGLVHRDLKPGNIMVEFNRQGEPWPYVLDFGLARPIDGDHLTVTGSILGTPAYMAPEQARGEPTVDHRCDIYALGATLYHLMTNQPPFHGKTPAAVIMSLQAEEPLSPSRLRADLPNDLVSICLKAMEKEPGRRYDSARAFAEDLHRFLDNKPVNARPPDLFYRLFKTASRHKLPVSTIAIALILLIGMSAYTLVGRLQAVRREQQVLQFTERVERLNALHRHMVMSRRHPTEKNMALLRDETAQMTADRNAAGRSVQGPAAYAIGRAHLTLGEYDRARTFLEEAWQKGYQTQRTAYALGQAFARLYERQLRAEQIRASLEKRLPHLEDLERDLKSKALDYFNLCRGATWLNPRLLEAEIAYTQQDPARVSAMLDAITDPPPWQYEIDVLRGNAYRELARAAENKGKPEEGAELRVKALTAYDRAAATAESDLSIYCEKSRLYLQFVKETSPEPAQTAEMVALGLAEIEKALSLDPDNQEAMDIKLHLYLASVQNTLDRSESPGPDLLKALSSAEDIARTLRDQSAAHLALGVLHFNWARSLINSGGNPAERLQAANDALARVPPRNRDVFYHGTNGLVWMNLARHVTQREEDEQKAVAAFQAASRLRPDSPVYPNNMGMVYLWRAERLQGQEKDEAQRRAARHFNRSATLGPDHFLPTYYLGRIHYALGMAAFERDEDAGSLFEKAVAFFTRGEKLKPKMVHFPLNRGVVFVFSAHAAYQSGEDPMPWLEKAYRAYERAAELAPKVGAVYQNLAIAYQLEGLYRCRTGQDPRAALSAAFDYGEQAEALSPSLVVLYGQAEIELTRAEWALRSGVDPSPFLNRADEVLTEMFQKDRENAMVRRGRGNAYLLTALFKEGNGLEPLSDYQRSLAAFAHGGEEPGVQLELARAAAYYARYLTRNKMDPSAVLQEGLVAAEKTLERRPSFAEARAIKSALIILLSSSREKQARQTLDTALADNPHLHQEWSNWPNGSFLVDR